MARDIEEFLRKAAERRAKQKGNAAPQKAEPQRERPARRLDPVVIEGVEIIDPQPPQKKKQRLQSDIGNRKLGTNRKRKPQPDMRRESVADHVERYLDTSSIAQHAEQLGDRIASIHDQVEKEVHQHLDHDISRVDDTPTITDDPSPAIFGKRNANAAIRLKEMLSNPNDVGNAILLAEILKRPDFD
ncbi:MAG: hypothetical protein AAF939_01885 [Planctomycetota bacterium]